MTCDEFDDVVHGLVRLELLRVSLREEALDHAARCGRCAERLSGAILLAEATTAAASSIRELQTPQAVEAALVAAYAGWHRRRGRRRRFEWAAAGVAAMALLILWATINHTRAPASPAPQKELSSPLSGPAQAAGTASTLPDEPSAAEQTDAASAAANQADGTGGFVPVPYSEGFGPGDPEMVVRVQLTRASLAELGYPVDAVRASDWIRADVLVGEDGWPRAVRIVQ